MIKRILTVALAVAALGAAPVTGVHAQTAPVAPATVDGPSIATYRNRRIDLRISWEGATACTSDSVTTECFANEAEMNTYLAQTGGGAVTLALALAVTSAMSGVVPLVTCASSLSLYDGTGFGGNVLHLSTRLTHLNLSAWGFDNATSSYMVGGCAAAFSDGASGGAPTYPGNTGANVSASSMLSGWDNRVGSVYIN